MCTEVKTCNRVQGYKGACTHKCTKYVSDSDSCNTPKNFWELRYLYTEKNICIQSTFFSAKRPGVMLKARKLEVLLFILFSVNNELV